MQRVLVEVVAGVDHDAVGCHASRLARAPPAPQERDDLVDDVGVLRRRVGRARRARLCVTTSVAPVSATTSAIAGSWMSGGVVHDVRPGGDRARATSGWKVSTEITAPEPASAATIGTTRSISSSTGIAGSGSELRSADVDPVGAVPIAGSRGGDGRVERVGARRGRRRSRACGSRSPSRRPDARSRTRGGRSGEVPCRAGSRDVPGERVERHARVGELLAGRRRARERMSRCTVSFTSHTLMFIPATTRPPASQNAMHSRAARSPRTTSSAPSASSP